MFEIPAGGIVTQIRYALPEGVEDVEILARDRDGKLGSVSCSRSGSYLVFTLDEGVTAFYAAEETKHTPWLRYAGIAAAVLAVVAGSTILLSRKRKKSK